MKEFELVTAWMVCRKKEEHVQFHSHDFYELVYYCQDSGCARVGEESYTISADMFVLIPPNVEHEEYFQVDCNIFCIGFRFGEELQFEILRDTNGVVRTIIRTIIREITEQQMLYKKMIALKMHELMVEIRRLEDIHPKSSTKNFEYVINYIAQNYHEKIFLRNLAEQLHISYDYFQHRFKEIQGESPQQFLVRKRLEAAERMLADQSLSCTEIAYRCGFSNSAQFSAIFKRERGMTPQRYRQIK